MIDTIKVSTTEKEIQEDLDKLKFTKTQRKLFDELSEILTKALDFPLITIRGFLAFAFIENQKYQTETMAEQEASDKLKDLTQEELIEYRIKNVGTIMDGFKTKISRVVRVKKKEHLLDEAVNKAFQHYKDNFSTRPPDIKGN